MKKKRTKQVYPERFRKLVEESAESYQENLGHKNLAVDIYYMKVADPENSNAGMTMSVRHSYLDATMRVYPGALDEWKNHGDDSVRDMVAHEIAHLETNKLHDLTQNRFVSSEEVRVAFESLTELLGRYIRGSAERKKKSKQRLNRG